MKKFKTLGSLLLVLMFAVCAATTASAANTTDTGFSGYVGYSYSQAGATSPRAKQNSTSVYIHNKSSINLWIRTFGYTPTGSAGAMVWTNQTKGTYAIVRPGKYAVKQYIYENGGRSAYLDITTADSSLGTRYISGVWSPDTAGRYPSAN